MLYMNVALKAKNPADADKIRDLLAEQGRLSRQEPGCVKFEVYQSQKDRSQFFLLEYWESAAALDAHRLAYAYTTVYQPQVIPLVEREGHPSDLVG